MSSVNISTKMKKPASPIKGPGLTVPGIVILQGLFILLVETCEYAIGKIGAATGIALLLAIAGGIYLGRSGSEFATAVNPPLAFLFSTILVLCTLGGVGLHLARLGLDLVTALATVAPYLVVGAVGSWGFYLYRTQQSKAVKTS